jgi:ABC-2 type transport system ATP-binding protein/lipopolysaccharide transport system ATP-binding protein
MASIIFDRVGVDFPLYQGGSRSLKKRLLWRGTGGAVAHDSANRIVIQALKDLSFTIGHGDRVGLVGPNGAGKTTLLRVMAGVYEPSRGRVFAEGHICPLFDVGFGMDLDATGYDNILLRGLYLGLGMAEVRTKVDEIAEFTELGAYLDMPMRTYSSGMIMRLAFAVSTSIAPEILLMDEWILAGDAHFLDKARRRMAEFVNRSSILVLASHSDQLMREWCNKAIYLNAGSIRAAGPIDTVMDRYIQDAAEGEGQTAAAAEAI